MKSSTSRLGEKPHPTDLYINQVFDLLNSLSIDQRKNLLNVISAEFCISCGGTHENCTCFKIALQKDYDFNKYYNRNEEIGQ